MSICCCEPPRQEIEFWMPSRLMGPSVMGVRYEVSDKGRVRAINKGGVPGEIGLLHTLMRGRYMTVHNTQGDFKIHHLVADAFIGPRPDGMQINHIDGNRNNNRRSNLEYCTASENTKHAYRTGLAATLKGSKNPCAVLNEEQVRQIRAKVKEGVSHIKTAAAFGVSRQLVDYIISGKRWGHLI